MNDQSRIIRNEGETTKSVFRILALTSLTSVLCSCGVGQAIFSSNEEEREYLVADMAIAPPLLFTGVWPDPDEKQRNEKLPEYIRIIRNRNLGKVTSNDRRITYMAMQYAYPLLGKKSQEEVIRLLGSPDRIVSSRGHVGFIYGLKGLAGSLNGPVLFFQ